MSTEEFVPVTGWSDTELAELFAAPLDHVAMRRRDAGAENGVLGT
jgi:hypothetical protein